MIPKLYESNATSFNTLGITALPDAETCDVTEERNSQYELELKYPVTGYGFEELQVGRHVVAKPNETSRNQAFEIYQISKPMNGLCTVKAEHISYRLKRIICAANTGYTKYAAKAMEEFLKGWALGDTVPFTFSSDIEFTSTKTIKLEQPVAFRTALMGMSGSIIDLFGGEFEWDNWNVILHRSRGSDNGVRIKYGKNLTGLKVETDISESYTAIDAYYVDAETGTVTESGLITVSDNPFAYQRCRAIDVSGEFDSAPTQAQLATWAASYLSRNATNQILSTVDAEFYPNVDLNDIEHVSMCDTVTIDYDRLGVKAKSKVVKTKYDSLKERYKSVTIGRPKVKIADAIRGLTYVNY